MIDVQPLLAIALLFPVVLCGLATVPAVHRNALDLMPFAPIPALVAAVLVPDGAQAFSPDLFLGMTIEMHGTGRLFLGFAAALWLLAGIYARHEMRKTERPAFFASTWCLALAGNLGVFLAGDVVTFYAAFACLTFAAYPAIVASGTDDALRAGRVYIVYSVIGETTLLAGLMLAAVEAPSLAIADLRATLFSGTYAFIALPLILIGFAVKAGLVPLHSWLPLAHPAAPPAASAVLSGALVKAGLFGMMAFVPQGGAALAWQDVLFGLGLFGCFYGIAAALTQSAPKTILAYSTVSQMSLLVAILSAGFAADAPATVFAIATLYALHHGFAKGALFMGAGLAPKVREAGRTTFLALLALAAASVAGLPLTGGALAKLAGKMPFDGLAELAINLSAAGTALVMLRFLVAAKAQIATKDEDRAASLRAPFAVAVLAAFVLPWLLFPPLSGEPLAYAFDPGNLWSATWPLLLAASLSALWHALRLRSPAVPPGDILVPVTAMLRPVEADFAAMRAPALPIERIRQAGARAAAFLETGERALSRWSAAGPVFVLFLLAAAFLPLG